MCMSSRSAGLPVEVSPSVEVLLDVEAPDARKAIDDYRLVRSLLRSVLLSIDVEAFNSEGAFRIQDSWDFLLRLVYHFDHFSETVREAWRISREAEEKVGQANRRADDAQLSKLKAEEKAKSLEEKMKRLEAELSKAWAEIEAQLSVEKRKHGGSWRLPRSRLSSLRLSSWMLNQNSPRFHICRGLKISRRRSEVTFLILTSAS
ncbi:uncharacterized protein [Elaeis guineensis]|uniref:uncharacterized protein n=1 Tax=Elaeis guineensis var. tenera TaxID=51953 RepID=UPI003C6D9F57